ncbi:hypothetical protein C8P64_1177 [Christiangramia gaetbulicola]|uniref:DUF5689 domain-containing protein n=1 Tax=Christiangramia gaetbulicola TaxID=703340 RepID=A0A2T6AN54_9FLAO|nr:DUF5689 domain-containing protein [Christiangramia gaetbulicola]PTX45186.1 hypothetical protein C8P64_1177 [Christiangramia gaetbulicola]
MKKIFVVCALIGFLLNSCVKTDDYDTPGIDIPEIDITGDLTSIMAVKGNFDPRTGEIYTFQDSETWFEGYVISSDAGGNFYKEIILQDKPEDPTSGIQILLDDNSIYETFDVGRKVVVKLDGLSLSFNNGVLQLGIQNRGDVVAIPGSLIADHIIRTEVKQEIKPLQISIDDFSDELKNLYIQINDVQFDPNLVKENNLYSFASNVVDRYDGERQLISCQTGSTSILSTSTFSDFKSLLLPTGSGSVEGILTRDFYDEHYVIMINTPDALNMNGERCDPVYLDCGNNLVEGSKFLLEENFDGVTSNTTLNSRGWTNINVSGGEKKFTPTLSAGNRILRISAYNTIESPLEAWLVTPEIDLDDTSNEILLFDMLSSYDNGLLMKVFITSDFTGDPRTTTWTELDANIPLGPSGANSTIFRESKIDISCLEGEIWIGFRYLGAAPDKTTTYDLDNIRVIGE